MGQGYGHLPARNALVTPWDEVAVDLIGPWRIDNPYNPAKPFEFLALTCIDPVTNLVEIKRIPDKSSETVAREFENLWLSRYPKPNRCIHDNGGEFIGPDFTQMLSQNNIEPKPTTKQSPQSNGICERMHQVIANVLRIIMRDSHIENNLHATIIMDQAIATCVHAHRSAVNSTLQCSPGSLVFGRDMFVDVPLIADLVAIRNQRQLIIDKNLIRHNRKRYDYHFRVGEWVMVVKKDWDKYKMKERLKGPYQIIKTRTNRTVRLRMPGDMIVSPG